MSRWVRLLRVGRASGALAWTAAEFVALEAKLAVGTEDPSATARSSTETTRVLPHARPTSDGGGSAAAAIQSGDFHDAGELGRPRIHASVLYLRRPDVQ